MERQNKLLPLVLQEHGSIFCSADYAIASHLWLKMFGRDEEY